MSSGSKAGWLGGVLLLIPFLLPLWAGALGRTAEQIENLLHVPAFFALTVCLVAILPARLAQAKARWLALALAVLCAGLLEVVQPRFGRTAELIDFGMGFLGSASAFCFLWGMSLQGLHRWIAFSSCLVLAVLSLLPLGCVVVDQRHARRDFPLIASFESWPELGRWSFHGVHASRSADHVKTGRYSLRVEVDDTGGYPSFFLDDEARDWSSLKRLCTDLFVEGAQPVRLWIRVDDLPGNPPYAERFQVLHNLAPGFHSLCLDTTDLRTEGGRPLDLRHIHAFGIFFDGAESGDVVYFDSIRGIQ